MFHVYWPATACLTLFLIVGVIMVMLRYGPRLCKLRHTALPTDADWEEKAFEQKVSIG
ncbi:PREDICTED: uncharacterized protein LOC108565381 [Nicrophorus vespilloides]|uniref:Uncharacterized protein LOC108565381 n=1 Tax=Nicrophorus vespilloides TaxID=110193 RepID=A0ABM1N0E4_NICVS|nr:PREDICTED: uncharacterized protein LOC108565381 [Nicrophorus vespilloides]